MGTNSIGWSVVEEHKGVPKDIIDCGSRIFIRSVEDKTPTPKNQKRRESRLLRRVIERRRRRKMRLRNYLLSKGFLPEILKDEPNPEKELNKLGDPYDIRAKALDEKLTKHEFGRAILHLGTRRGFLSNRKTGFGNLREDTEALEFLKDSENEQTESDKSDKEGKKVKENIEKLREKITEDKKRTLGEYLATLPRKRNRGEVNDLRTDRKMYQDEFELIWERQSEISPDIYTESIKAAIEEIIFFQRPITWEKDTIGKCSLETKHKRISCSRLEFQQFRYWQDIANLSWDDIKTGEIDRRLSLDQKKVIANALEREKNLTWKKLRGLLEVDNKTKFNLESVSGKKTKGIKGNRTACDIREIIGDKWDLFDEKQQTQLVEDLISYKSKKGLKKRLQNHWKFNLEKAVKLAVLELETKYGNLSLKAIKKILPYLKEGRLYSKEGSDEEKGSRPTCRI